MKTKDEVIKEKLRGLFNFSHSGVYIAAMLDNRKTTKHGLYPVKIRVTYKRERKYYPTGKAYNEADWNDLPKSKSKIKVSDRADIQQSFEIIKTEIQTIFSKKGYFSFEDLAVRLGKATTFNVNTAFKAYIEKLKNEGRIGSMVYYGTTLKNLESFGGKIFLSNQSIQII